MRRRDLVALVAGATAFRPLAARAQQKAKSVIGYLSSGSAAASGPNAEFFQGTRSDRAIAIARADEVIE